MGVVGCSLISLFDLQVDDDGLWDYGCLVASWGLESCGCSFGVSMHLPQLVTVEKWGGCCLTVLGCGHWGACGAGDLASSGQGRVLGLGSHARGRLVSGCVPPSVGAVCTSLANSPCSLGRPTLECPLCASWVLLGQLGGLGRPGEGTTVVGCSLFQTQTSLSRPFSVCVSVVTDWYCDTVCR